MTSDILINAQPATATFASPLAPAWTTEWLCQELFQQHKDRIYCLAFWMTDHELAAEALTQDVFTRVFASSYIPSQEAFDAALITELREIQALGVLTLECNESTEVLNVRGQAKRVDLERAVIQLPATERLLFLMHDVEQYEPSHIGKLLGLTNDEVRCGLHQARLRMRELLAN